MLASAPGWGQDQTAQADEPIDEVVVTGSRIPRDPNLGANVPIQSVGALEIQMSGAADIVEILNDIPALMGSTTGANSIAGIFALSTGENILQLRGLGSERTLVLVDGRRHVSGVAGAQSVDVGSIPQQLIERVDVLTGGASAIYGADAVSGVVNFILKDDFEGLELDFNGGASLAHGDGENFRISGIFGQNFGGNRGNVTLALDYSRTDNLLAADRSFTRNNQRADDLPNPALRFQLGDISPGSTPNFAKFYDPSTMFPSDESPCDLFGLDFCYGFFNRGFRIPDQADFERLWGLAFPGEPIPNLTAAELALIERAATAPTRLIHSQPNFSLTSPGGVLLPGGLYRVGIDLDNNGVDDCLDSWTGFFSTYDNSPPALGFIGGCWIIEDDGSVRPLQDGLIAGDINQFGQDGIANVDDRDFLTPELEKFSINTTANYELSPNAKLFGEFKWVHQTAKSGGPQTAFWDLLTVSPDNPYIDQLPAELAAVGHSQGLFITRDPIDIQPGLNYINVNTRDTYRVVGGIEGNFSNDWTYEVSVNYGNFQQTTTNPNVVLVDRWFAAIDVISDPVTGNPICRSDIDPTPPPTTPFGIPTFDASFLTFNPGDGSCKPANILGGTGAMSKEAQDFFTTTTVDKFELEQFVLSAVLGGDTESFFSLPAGPIGFAAGAEYRDEKSTSIFDDNVRGLASVTTPDINAGQFIKDNEDLGQNSFTFDSGALTQNSGGSFDVYEFFGEVSIPVFVDMPFAQELTIDAAARFSDYSTVGSTLTWKAGGTWTPLSGVRFRGTYAVAIRAPNVQELFDPDQAIFPRPIDPCDQSEIDALIAVGDPRGPIRQANCLAAGIPAGFKDPLTARFVGVSSGNPNLTEEEAKTYTVGAILQPEFIPGLTITVDYYNIRITDAITAVSTQDIVNNCFDSADFPNDFCDLFTRNTDQSSPQFNGFNFIRQTQINFAALETDGIDFSAIYQFGWQAYDFTLNVSGTKVFALDRFFDPSDPTLVDPELGELQRPEWAGNVRATVRRGPISVNWQTQYLGKQALRSVEIETAEVIFGPAGIADRTFIHDISFSYVVDDRFLVYAGINNLGNERPFITEVAFPVNPLGRSFFIGITATLNDLLPF